MWARWKDNVSYGLRGYMLGKLTILTEDSSGIVVAEEVGSILSELWSKLIKENDTRVESRSSPMTSSMDRFFAGFST